MTETQHNVLDAVAVLTAQHGYPPSLAEVGRFAGVHTSTAAYHVRTLCNAGVLMHVPGIPRSLMVTEMGRPLVSRARRIP